MMDLWGRGGWKGISGPNRKKMGGDGGEREREGLRDKKKENAHTHTTQHNTPHTPPIQRVAKAGGRWKTKRTCKKK